MDDDERRRVRSGSRTSSKAGKTNVFLKGDSLVLHCASLTAQNKMASVKKSM